MDVEAKVIDTDMTALSETEKWLAKISARAALVASEHTPHKIRSEQDYKMSKRARADVSREITAIEQERKNMTATIKKAVRDFEANTKLAAEPLSAILSEYDKYNGEYDEGWKANRLAELTEKYEEYAPSLMDLVSLDRIISRYGSDRGKGWLNRSTNVVAAKQMLEDACNDIAEKEKSIDALVPEEDRTEVKAHFFRTLDLNSALGEARRLKEQRERVIELERARAEYVPESAPEPVVVETRPPVVERPVAQGNQVSDRFPFVMDMVCTWEQANMLCDYARKNGIAVNRVHRGTIADAYHEGGYYDAG